MWTSDSESDSIFCTYTVTVIIAWDELLQHSEPHMHLVYDKKVLSLILDLPVKSISVHVHVAIIKTEDSLSL